MNDRAFFDTNILVYLFDKREAQKRTIVGELLGRYFSKERGVLSTQVLQEFFVNVTRKAAQLSSSEATAVVANFLRMEVVVVTGAHLLDAIAIHERYQLSFWDGLILAAAKSSGASVLFTEDLSHGRVYDGVRVENPFRSATS